jgi:hypothetical protein
MPESYIKFLIQSLTGVEVDQRLVDIFAVFVLVIALGASALLNTIDRRKSRKASKPS